MWYICLNKVFLKKIKNKNKEHYRTFKNIKNEYIYIYIYIMWVAETTHKALGVAQSSMFVLGWFQTPPIAGLGVIEPPQ